MRETERKWVEERRLGRVGQAPFALSGCGGVDGMGYVFDEEEAAGL